MSQFEMIDNMKHIKIIGIGSEGCSLAYQFQPSTPHVHVLFLRDQILESVWPKNKNSEALAQTLADTNLLFVATNICDVDNERNVDLVVREARKLGVLVVGVALSVAAEANHLMQQTWYSHVDALLMGDPDQLHKHLSNAADEVAEITNEYGHVNVDFEDIRYILSMRGVIGVGTGTAAGPNRAQRAALAAIPKMDLTQAKGLLILISAAKGGLQLTESRQAMRTVNSHLPESTHVIFGAAYDDSLGDQLKVTMLVSGLTYPAVPVQ